MQRRTLLFVVVGVALVALGATAIAVYAQDQPGAGLGFRGGGGGQPGGLDAGRMMMMMRGMGGAAIAVEGDSVYVIYMGTLFKFNAETLEEEAQVQLRPQGMPMGGPGGGGFGGGRGGPGAGGGAPQ